MFAAGQFLRQGVVEPGCLPSSLGLNNSRADLASQVKLGQRVRGHLTQIGLGVLAADLVADDGDEDLAADAPRRHEEPTACSLQTLSRDELLHQPREHIVGVGAIRATTGSMSPTWEHPTGRSA